MKLLLSALVLLSIVVGLGGCASALDERRGMESSAAGGRDAHHVFVNGGFADVN